MFLKRQNISVIYFRFIVVVVRFIMIKWTSDVHELVLFTMISAMFVYYLYSIDVFIAMKYYEMSIYYRVARCLLPPKVAVLRSD